MYIHRKITSGITKRPVIACVSGVVVAFAVLLFCLQGRQSPHPSLLAELDVSDVEYISVYASYGDEDAKLSEDDTAEIVRQLNTVNLTGAGTQDYAAHFSLRQPMFHVRLKDGLEFDFSAWKPYYIINTETFGEKFGYSLEDGNAVVTGNGYRLLNNRYNNDVCNHLRITYDALCRKYFPR